MRTMARLRRRRQTAERQSARPAVTDARTGLTHLVSDEAMAAGRRAGRYVAACGAEVLAGSLTAPESGRCRRCRSGDNSRG